MFHTSAGVDLENGTSVLGSVNVTVTADTGAWRELPWYVLVIWTIQGRSCDVYC